jgi:hypothetical protein
MYCSNPLSFFVSIAAAINLAIARTSRITFSDIVVTVAIVLTMSKLVFGITALLYLGFLVFGVLKRRLLVLKLIAVLAIVMSLYYILFPGLFIANFSEGMIMTSIMLRLMDLLNALGIGNLSDQLIELAYIYRPSHVYVIGEGYSTVATFLRSELLIPSLFVVITGVALYVYRARSMITWPTMVYAVTLLTCIVTQFAIPFAAAASFQLILGFALFPLFKKIWAPTRAKRFA